LEKEDIPQELMDVSPVAICGITDEGYAVFLAPFGRHDSRAMIEKYGLERCFRFNTIYMEKFMKYCQEEGAKKGKKVYQIIEIMDCEGYSYRQMASRASREFMQKMQQEMDAHYPELLRYAMIVNAPKIFAILFNIMKPFIPKQTLEKIDIYGPEPEKWKAVVREKFPVHMIPPYWGGTLEGVDEYCSGHPIWIQGPKDMRPYMRGLAVADADFHKQVVNSREIYIKEVNVVQKDTILEWKFKTEAHDIAFQLTYSTMVNGKEGKPEDILPNKRVDAQNTLQEGSHTCEKVGKYCFVFDNSFSLMKAKTLLYRINVIDVDHQQNVENFEDCPEA
jgi:hypothetical protein